MRLWIGAGLAALAYGGCSSPGAFQCEDDDQCRSGSALGICQPNGYCSFEDPTCESGQRYGEQSGPLAGQCIAPTTGTDTTIPGTDSSAVDSSGPADPATTGTDDGGTTNPIDPSMTSTSAGTTGDGSSGEPTTGEVPVCTEVYVDDFDDGMLDPMYDQQTGAGMTMTEAGGELRFGFDGVAMSDYSFVGWTFGPLTSHRFWVEQVSLLPTPSPATTDMCLTTGVWGACITTFDGEHEAFVGPEGRSMMVAGTPADPATARFVAISRVDDVIRFEISGDGVVWQTFHTEASKLAPADDIYVFLGAGNWEPVGAGDEYAMDAMGLCAL